MKKIKILLVLLTVTAGVFYSCSDNKSIEDQVVTTSKSISLRATLNELKKANNISGKTTTLSSFCFNFVYPLTLSYNNGTVITVASYQGLLDVLRNETNSLYIDGMAYPFQVTQETATGTTTVTINNETEFFTLISTCSAINTVNNLATTTNCYQIVYPISVINATGQTVVINNVTALNSLISSNSAYQLNIVFPISLVLNNQTVTANSLYDFFNYFNTCTGNPCNCPTTVDPVCVQTTSGTVQFDNACLAQCAGYTTADFVNCNPVNTPTFGQLLGSCFNVAYPVQVQYQGALVTVHNDGELLQYWFPSQSSIPAFNYPITVVFSSATSPMTMTFVDQAAFEAAISTHCN